MKNKKTICLNMIVKNESAVIRRCLDSVKSLIDTWVIVDTGSTDGTQEIIKDHFSDLPGELHERPWVNFAHNRNEAMRLAQGKTDYVLLIDADDRLVISENFTLPSLEADIYTVIQREGTGLTFREHQMGLLVRNNGDFEWEGVLHEYLKPTTQKAYTVKGLTGIFNEYINDGSRAKDPNKVAKDIEVLKKAIEDHPDSSRYVFYLARTFWSMRDCPSAIEYFTKRTEMGGDPMEVYYSLLYIGLAQRFLEYPPDVFLKSFSRAYLYRPSRTEALYEVARHYTDSGNYLLGYLAAKLLITIPPTKDNLFVESWVDDWGALLYFFICSRQLGKNEEARSALKRVLKNPRLPSDIRVGYQLDEWANQLRLKGYPSASLS
jgi:glycosyltransferase involved in cell wall biosynthesis